MNKQIERLIRAEEKARRISRMRDRNEIEWNKARAKAEKSAEWLDYCKQQGIHPHYNYGDVIC